MHQLLSKLWETRARRAKGDKGFTLIELLVVVVILGVLIAIAIPLYLNYRKGANDSASQSDLRNAISVLEVCNSDNGTYPTATFTIVSSATVSSAAAGTCTTQTINISNGTQLQYKPVGTVGVSYTITDSNTNGNTAKVFCYNSANGGAVKTLTTGTYLTATC